MTKVLLGAWGRFCKLVGGFSRRRQPAPAAQPESRVLYLYQITGATDDPDLWGSSHLIRYYHPDELAEAKRAATNAVPFEDDGRGHEFRLTDQVGRVLFRARPRADRKQSAALQPA